MRHLHAICSIRFLTYWRKQNIERYTSLAELPGMDGLQEQKSTSGSTFIIQEQATVGTDSQNSRLNVEKSHLGLIYFVRI